jgi:predicted nucleic acid-binding Zn ribbon protein
MAKLLGRLGAPPSSQVMELAFTRWEEVVGSEFSCHLHPLRLQGSTLVLGVDHPAWATRARMESGRIISRLRELGDDTIERIEVVVERP